MAVSCDVQAAQTISTTPRPTIERIVDRRSGGHNAGFILLGHADARAVLRLSADGRPVATLLSAADGSFNVDVSDAFSPGPHILVLEQVGDARYGDAQFTKVVVTLGDGIADAQAQPLETPGPERNLATNDIAADLQAAAASAARELVSATGAQAQSAKSQQPAQSTGTDSAFAPITRWLEKADKTFQSQVMRRLSQTDAPAAGSQTQPPVAGPAKQPTPTLPQKAPVVEAPAPLGGGVVEAVERWMSRSAKEFQNKVVRRLADPSSPADTQPAPKTVEVLKPIAPKSVAIQPSRTDAALEKADADRMAAEQAAREAAALAATKAAQEQRRLADAQPASGPLPQPKPMLEPALEPKPPATPAPAAADDAQQVEAKRQAEATQRAASEDAQRKAADVARQAELKRQQEALARQAEAKAQADAAQREKAQAEQRASADAADVQARERLGQSIAGTKAAAEQAAQEAARAAQAAREADLKLQTDARNVEILRSQARGINDAVARRVAEIKAQAAERAADAQLKVSQIVRDAEQRASAEAARALAAIRALEAQISGGFSSGGSATGSGTASGSKLPLVERIRAEIVKIEESTKRALASARLALSTKPAPPTPSVPDDVRIEPTPGPARTAAEPRTTSQPPRTEQPNPGSSTNAGPARQADVGRRDRAGLLGDGAQALIAAEPTFANRKSCSRRAGRPVGPSGTYVVQAGDTLWGIADTYYRRGSRFERLKDANDAVVDPDLIYPCQRLKIPRRR